MDSSDQGKNILLFSDGTGNSSGKLFKTNVWRTYEAVDLGLAKDGERVQVAYYDNGVGTSKFKIFAVFAGIFGFGLQRNVRAIYQYVCRNWEDGDQIYCFGFSRGAFTIRLVAYLLATRGIVPYESDRELKARTRDVLRDLQRENEPNLIPYLTRFNRWVRTAAVAVKRALVGPRYEIQTRFDPQKIAFVGVWDTVAAYGGPSAEITRAIDNFIYPLTMTDQRLSDQVQIARHALSLDDERDAFHPVPWDEYDWYSKARDQHRGDPDAQEAFRNRMQQLWFAGVHSDVGGGYPDESLSFVSLAWMMKEAEGQGVRFLPEAVKRIRDMSNSLGPIHNSRGGFASYYRYQPRRIEAFFHERALGKEAFEETRSYRDPVKGERIYPPRGYLMSCKVHESVAARIVKGTDDYAPFVLPPEFEIIPFNFNGAGGNPRVDPAQLDALKSHKDNWAEEREKIYDLVWWRRVAYFSTVVFTALLVLLPVYVQRVMYPPTTDGQWIWGRLTSGAKVLPGFVQPWVRASQTSPLVFFTLVLLIIAGSLIGMRLEHATRSNMRHLWLKRRSGDSFARSRRSWVEKLRRMPAYQQTIQDLKWYTFPWLVGLFLLLPGILYLSYFVLTQVTLSFVDPGLCIRTRTEPLALPTQGVSSFDTRRPCNSTGVQVQAGQPYAIELAAPRPVGAAEPWSDGKYPASPIGISARTMEAPGYLGAPLRRLIDARYLQVIYQIRPKKRPVGPWHPVIVHALDFTFNKANPSCWIYRADFVASEPGELFLFANDVVALWDFGYFYRNNRGTAQVYVHALHSLGGEPIKSAERHADPCRLITPGRYPGSHRRRLSRSSDSRPF